MHPKTHIAFPILVDHFIQTCDELRSHECMINYLGLCNLSVRYYNDSFCKLNLMLSVTGESKGRNYENNLLTVFDFFLFLNAENTKKGNI